MLVFLTKIVIFTILDKTDMDLNVRQIAAKFLQSIYTEWKNGTLNNLNYFNFDNEFKTLDQVALTVQNGKINDR